MRRVGTLYYYNGTGLVPITSVPYRMNGKANATVKVGYLQAPAFTYGMNFSTFTYRAWDGRAYSRANGSVTINVLSVR